MRNTNIEPMFSALPRKPTSERTLFLSVQCQKATGAAADAMYGIASAIGTNQIAKRDDWATSARVRRQFSLCETSRDLLRARIRKWIAEVKRVRRNSSYGWLGFIQNALGFIGH